MTGAGALRSVRSLLDRFLPRGAIVLSVLTLGYFVMGQLRNRVFANAYGTSAQLDAYYAAFTVPELALDVLVAAGLTAPFVPIFNSLREHDEEAANRFGRTVLTVGLLVMMATIGILFVIAPTTVEWVGAGFDAVTRDLYVDLFRVMCLTPIVFAASITLGEVLVANQRFAFYALAPILYTGGIIGGTVLLHDRMGIFGTAIGAVAGAIAHLAIRLIGIFRTSFRPRPALAVQTAAFGEFVRLMLPRMVSYPIDPLVVAFFTNLASTMAAGSVSVLNFARDYQVAPVSLIGVSFSLAAFPILARAWAEGDMAAFRSVLGRNLLTIGALTTIAAVAVFVLAEFGIGLLLRGGAFGSAEVSRTALVLSVFALSIPFDSLSYPLSRALYATHNTLLQVIASVVGVIVVIAVATALAPSAGIVAIPLGYTAGSAVKVALLTVFLIPRLRVGPRSPRPAP